MNTAKTWIVGLAVVTLLAVGVMALAGNGFGTSASDWTPRAAATGDCVCDLDDDGDGIPNAEDTDWTRPMDGTGYGAGRGYGQGLCGDCPLDGSG